MILIAGARHKRGSNFLETPRNMNTSFGTGLVTLARASRERSQSPALARHSRCPGKVLQQNFAGLSLFWGLCEMILEGSST